MKYFILAITILLITPCFAEKKTIEAIVSKIGAQNRYFTIQDLGQSKANDPIIVQVPPGDSSINYTNKKIRAVLDDSTSPPSLEFIWPIEPSTEKKVETINLSFLVNTINPSAVPPLKVGDSLPQFALYDQNANTITHNDLLGKTLVINFIFTRCTKVDMCPKSTQLMAELQRLCRENLINDVRFVSFSFDPQYDTPGILNLYARSYNIDFDNYSFLTGDSDLIKRLTRFFGVYAMYKKGDISHTMSTTIVDPTGRMAYGSTTNTWDPKKMLSIIQKIQNKEKAAP